MGFNTFNTFLLSRSVFAFFSVGQYFKETNHFLLQKWGGVVFYGSL